MATVTVTNCAGGSPINGALVTDLNTGAYTYSNPNGMVDLSGASVGDTIEVQQSGASPKKFNYSGQDVTICLDFQTGTGTGTGTHTTGCIIASACLGEDADEVMRLRKVRDAAISSDPIARDFFHVFWSRYYEWSPGVARIANSDEKVADHIRWGFLDPWLAWLDFVAIVGRRSIDELTDEERDAVLERLSVRRTAWVSELPALLAEKRPADDQEVFDAFERFRAAARTVFDDGADGVRGGTGVGHGRRSS